MAKSFGRHRRVADAEVPVTSRASYNDELTNASYVPCPLHPEIAGHGTVAHQFTSPSIVPDTVTSPRIAAQRRPDAEDGVRLDGDVSSPSHHRRVGGVRGPRDEHLSMSRGTPPASQFAGFDQSVVNRPVQTRSHPRDLHATHEPVANTWLRIDAVALRLRTRRRGSRT